nr:MAG TPA: hypothetical protein [Caudoviricetes sp.]
MSFYPLLTRIYPLCDPYGPTLTSCLLSLEC